MKSSENPFQPPVDAPRRRAVPEGQELDILSEILSGFSMLVIPALAAIATAAICQYLDETLGWDQRYVSLLLGFPPLIVAIGLSAYYWKQKHRLVATVGVLLWLCYGVFATLTTLAFWGG